MPDGCPVLTNEAEPGDNSVSSASEGSEHVSGIALVSGLAEDPLPEDNCGIHTEDEPAARRIARAFPTACSRTKAMGSMPTCSSST